MLNSKLILIDGITGSGKSTTAQFLASQLKENDIKVKWYHETQTIHPLSYEEDVEVFDSHEEVKKFMETIPKLWKQFTNQVMESEEVHIIESFLLQDTVRILFQNKIEHNRIIDFVCEIEEILKPLNPILLYFHQLDAEASIRRIWKRRGDAWKKWFIDSDIQTPYVKSISLHGEEGVIKLWSDYQAFTNQLFEKYQFRKLSIENSQGNWSEYYHQILNLLGLNLVNKKDDLTLEEKSRFCGIYKELEGDLDCTIEIVDGHIVCDLIWPDIRILSLETTKSNQFYLESFPVYVQFEENPDKSVKAFSISGAKKELEGRKLYKRAK